MTTWTKYLDHPELPPVPELLPALSEALRSPDPVLRDDQAYTLFARWIPVLPLELLRPLGDEMAARLADSEIQARSFAPLVLAKLVRRGVYAPDWQAAFARWYPAETDLRGYHAHLGWLHAVAHGADLLGELGRCPEVDPFSMLELAAARLLAPTGHLFDAMEDDRLGAAIALTLTRPELTERQCSDWLVPIAADFEAGEPGPVPAYASNTMRTLRVVHLLADRGVRQSDGGPVLQLPRAAAVKAAVAGVLATCAPYQG
ncbi:DUF2785 domain-containing protein [Kitasatospora sp. NPDC002227]|uniref:DUF2785 domain-containing protein n=1 Tax=Kitasatospora sp. NPDC002227 TaxID=3154773 RepID=UPI00331A05F8